MASYLCTMCLVSSYQSSYLQEDNNAIRCISVGKSDSGDVVFAVATGSGWRRGTTDACVADSRTVPS